MDSVDLDSLAWRAVELAVQRRRDPRLVVATRPTVAGPTSTARLVAGLCNAAAGRRAIALFGIDGTDVIGVAEVPDADWIDTIAARFPGVVPALATATIEADGARIVALAADDPGTLVAAMRSGRVVIPWFDGTLADRPPPTGVDRAPMRPAGRVEVGAGWLERTGPCTPGSAVPATDAPVGDTDAATTAGADGAGTAASAGPDSTAGNAPGIDTDAPAGTGVVVWRGMLDIALALDTSTVASGAVTTSAAAAAAAAATAAADRAAIAGGAPTDGTDGFDPVAVGSDWSRGTHRGVAIADRDVSVTLLADGSANALSLDVQVHPTPGAVAATRSEGGVVLDPMLPCRLYLAAAAGAAVFDESDELGGSVRLLVSLRFPGDDRLVATMATLARDTAAASLRWSI